MKQLLVASPKWRCAVAFLAGLVLAVSLPKMSIYPLAWLAPGLILLFSYDHSPRKRFLYGYFAGLGNYTVSFSWLLLIPMRLHAVAGWLAVTFIMAAFIAAWNCVCWIIFDRLTANASPAQELSTRSRVLWPFICAAAWVTMEMLLARVLTGFPWNLLGTSQYKQLPLIQIASFTGVYGISFLIAWTSIALMTCAITYAKTRRIETGLVLIPPVGAVILVLSWGTAQLNHEIPARGQLKTALVQPAIPQRVIWDPAEKTNRFQELVVLSEKALAEKPDLLIWPEAALPNFFTRFNQSAVNTLTNLAISHHVWIILGANDTGVRRNEGGAVETNFFNTVFLISPQGELASRYHKRHLVPFGEFMPLSDWFPALNNLREMKASFSSGKGPVQFHLTDRHATVAPLICVEDTFPHSVREHVADDTDFLVNLTNDGWFGNSSAQWQHDITALFRAVENGLPLVRCANNGLTCWIDPHGRIHDLDLENKSDVYGPGFRIVSIPLRPETQKAQRTFYSRNGDCFGWTCAAITAVALTIALCRKSSFPKKEKSRQKHNPVKPLRPI